MSTRDAPPDTDDRRPRARRGAVLFDTTLGALGEDLLVRVTHTWATGGEKGSAGMETSRLVIGFGGRGE
jgi:hypothetical protein